MIDLTKMMKPALTRRSRPSEEGYALLWVMFLLAVFIIAMSVAVPKVTREIQRDHEIETVQRGKQYIRGIKMYYKKFNAYPPNAEVLVKGANNLRFLRKQYADPTTGNADWKPVYFGQNKAPTAMGFFGQPLTGSTLAGTGVNGASAPGSSFMSSSNSAAGANGTSGTASAPGDASTAAGGTDSTSTSAFGSSASGQTFGGGAIIGFSPNSPKQSILVYKTKNHYNEWEFVYDPLADGITIPTVTAPPAVGQQPGAPGVPITPSPSPQQ